MIYRACKSRHMQDIKHRREDIYISMSDMSRTIWSIIRNLSHRTSYHIPRGREPHRCSTRGALVHHLHSTEMVCPSKRKDSVTPIDRVHQGIAASLPCEAPLCIAADSTIRNDAMRSTLTRTMDTAQLRSAAHRRSWEKVIFRPANTRVPGASRIIAQRMLPLQDRACFTCP